MVKCLPTMRETQVQSLGQEDLLEKEMATHSSILAWKISWMEEPGRLQSTGLQTCLLPGRPPGFETHAPYEVSRVQFVDPSLSHPSRWSRARWPPKCQKQGWASRPEFRVLDLYFWVSKISLTSIQTNTEAYALRLN